jgi:hypothetical protein
MPERRDASSAEMLRKELRTRLKRLHRNDGEPSTREIAKRTGTAISHTTVHSTLRCLRTPQWGPLELVVEALRGDIEEFRRLWVAIRDAEDNSEASEATVALTNTGTPTPEVSSRLHLIELQATVALLEAARLSRARTDELILGVTERWVESISIHGFDSNHKARAELQIYIDWVRLQTHLSAGHDEVKLKRGRKDGKSVILREAIDIFDEYVDVNNLSVDVLFTYRAELAPRRDELNRRLGLNRSAALDWAGPRIGDFMKDLEIDEVSTGIFLVDE